MDSKKKIIYICENQRYIPFFGFSAKNLLSYERDVFSDQDGNAFPKELMKKILNLYKKKEFEVVSSEETDKDGYVYGFKWNFEFSKENSKTSLVRRRLLFFPQISCEHENVAGKYDIQKFIPSMKNPAKAIKISENTFNQDSHVLPTLISETHKHLEMYGTQVEGIFRIPGQVSRIKEVMDMYDKGEKVDLSNEDIHVTSGLFKAYIRDLSDPLLTYSLHESITEVLEKPKQTRVVYMSQLIEILPPGNQSILKCLLSLCYKIKENKNYNKMDIQNLAIIFGHSILRTRDESPFDMIDNMKKHQEVFEFLVVNFIDLYKEHDEEIVKQLSKNKDWKKTLKKTAQRIRHDIIESNLQEGNYKEEEIGLILDINQRSPRKRDNKINIMSGNLFKPITVEDN